jgi:hypothetical protein
MSVQPRLAVLAVLAAGGVAFGGYYLWPSGRHLAAGCPPRHAPVPAAARRALDAYLSEIKHAISIDADGSRDESWYDVRTGRDLQRSFDENGTPTDAFWTVPEGKFDRTVWLTYDTRTYTDDRQRELVPRRTELVIDGQANRDKVFHHQSKVVGRDVVAGKETVHLREHVHLPRTRIRIPKNVKLPKGFHLPSRLRVSPAVDYELDTWVDPLTYVTLRMRLSERGKSSITDVTWLPRTPRNLARTKLQIPKGFKREQVLRGSGVGFSFFSKPKTHKRCV